MCESGGCDVCVEGGMCEYGGCACVSVEGVHGECGVCRHNFDESPCPPYHIVKFSVFYFK